MNSFHKKIQYLTILTFPVLLFLSCSKDDEVESANPAAEFTYTVEELTANFVNNSENATSFIWNFGDGGTSAERHPTHLYEEAGTYTVGLTATGRDGTQAEITHEVTVIAPAPVAYFTFDVFDLTGTFINTSRNAASYLWNFGDGNTSTEEHPTHTYDHEGTYLVSLKVTGENGTQTETKKELFTVKPLVYPRSILTSGSMEDASAWNITTSDTLPQPSIEFTDDGVLRFSAEGKAEGLVWQQVTVPAAGTYRLSADVTGSGSTDMWFQVILGSTEPVEGEGYSGVTYAGMNTSSSDTCGVEPFEGNLLEVACQLSGIDQEGIVTFDEPTVIYLIIKAGSSGTLGTLTIDNIDLAFVGE